MQARRRPTRNSRFGASSCEKSLRSTPWSTRRSENPRRFATTRRYCRGRSRGYWPRLGPGASSGCASRNCRIAWLANRQLRSAARLGGPAPWMADPESMRALCGAGARTLIAMPAGMPSLRLLTDQTARVLTGLMGALDALALLTGKGDPPDAGRRARLYVADWWPAFVNAGRAFVMIGASALFWIVTAWPNGAFAITFTTIVVTLLAPRADEAYALAFGFSVGVGLGTVGAAIIGFAALPTVETFLGFSIMIGLYLIPVGAGVAQPWQTATFIGMTYNFIPLLAPANQMTYDTVQFYNSALAIAAGSVAGALSFRLLPPLSPTFRTRRLLALSLRDLRRLATDPARWAREDWEGRMHARIAALPD